MRLFTGTPSWIIDDGATAESAVEPPGDIDTNVAIIGAGITGALIAFHLASRSVEALLIDKRPPAMGSTCASTALLSYELDVPLTQLIEQRGERDAYRAYELGRRSIGTLEAVAEAVGESVDFQRRDCFYLAQTAGDAQDLYREYLTRRAGGFDIDLLTESDVAAVFPFARPLATRTPEAAEVDPVRLTRAALAYAERRGIAVLNDRVTEVDADGEAVRIRTAGGSLVRARRLVLAAGYETTRLIEIDNVRLTSTYVLATEPVARLSGWPHRALICESGGHPYFYMRTTFDNRILLGGEDEETSDPATMARLLPGKIAAMAAMLRAMFPMNEIEVATAWAGVFSASSDGLPTIGPHPRWPRMHLALGYGGNGITFAAIAAEMVADWVLGRPNSDAAIFRLNR